MSRKTQTRQLKSSSFKRSVCPIACALDVIGDKWTLLIIRDLFLGKHRFNEFLESSEEITTNVLANRLQQMDKAGLICKVPYQQNPVRHEYRLTETGKTIEPVIWSIIDWAESQLPGTKGPKRKNNKVGN